MSKFADPARVPEFFVTGIGSIEFLGGGILRHMLVTERKVGAKTLYIPVVNLVLTTANAQEAIIVASRALARSIVGPEQELVH